MPDSHSATREPHTHNQNFTTSIHSNFFNFLLGRALLEGLVFHFVPDRPHLTVPPLQRYVAKGCIDDPERHGCHSFIAFPLLTIHPGTYLGALSNAYQAKSVLAHAPHNF